MVKMLAKRTTFTSISPLHLGLTRELVVEFLHNYEQMIDLNPLVKERHPIPPPSHAPADERNCVWYSITDKISYLPGGIADGEVTYTCAFQKLPNGIQTHCYAPAGLDLREKWTLNGNLPGEPPEPQELGIGAPSTGLYLREDIDMRCNVLMTSFVKKTLVKAHAKLMDQIKARTQATSAMRQELKRTSTVNTLAPATFTASSMASSGMSARTSMSSGFVPGQPALASPRSVSTSSRVASPAPLLYDAVMHSPPVTQQHQSQTYFEPTGRVTALSSPPPPVPPKIPRDLEPRLSDQARQVYIPYRLDQTRKSSYQVPRLSHVLEKSQHVYFSPQPSPPQSQDSVHQRRSSIATTPLSAIDPDFFPDPLKIRPSSSGKQGYGSIRGHPDYPVMNPYKSDLIKTPGGIYEAPAEDRGAVYSRLASTTMTPRDLRMTASLPGPFMAELE